VRRGVFVDLFSGSAICYYVATQIARALTLPDSKSGHHGQASAN
jgi:hypothetical protein